MHHTLISMYSDIEVVFIPDNRRKLRDQEFASECSRWSQTSRKVSSLLPPRVYYVFNDFSDTAKKIQKLFSLSRFPDKVLKKFWTVLDCYCRHGACTAHACLNHRTLLSCSSQEVQRASQCTWIVCSKYLAAVLQCRCPAGVLAFYAASTVYKLKM